MFHEYEEDKSKLMIHKTEPYGKNSIKVVEYVDMETGEIVSSKDAHTKYGVTEIRSGLRKVREKKMLSLTKSQRDFANFILKFRNKSCGFLVPFDKICKWYSIYSNTRLDSVKRQVKSLIDAGILEDSVGIIIPHKDFMINSPSRSKAEARGESFKAGCIFDMLMVRKHVPVECPEGFISAFD